MPSPSILNFKSQLLTPSKRPHNLPQYWIKKKFFTECSLNWDRSWNENNGWLVIVTTIQQGCCCCSPINPHLLEACGLETAEINNLPPLLGDSSEDLGYCSHLSWQILQCHTNWEWCRRVSNLTQIGAMNMDIKIIINTKGWIHQE